MAGHYQYPQQYGHPDQTQYNHAGGSVLPGLNSAGGAMPGMPNMTGMSGPGGLPHGIQSTGSPLSQAPTLVPISTPSPASHSTTSQSTMGYSTSGQINNVNSNNNTPGYAHGSTGKYGWPYWIPAEGISRQVINEQVCKNLGNDALVRQRLGTGDFENQEGYAIDAYRMFTPAMIEDLKQLTLQREQEIQRDKDRDERRKLRAQEEQRESRKRLKYDSPPRGTRGNGNTPPVSGTFAPPQQQDYRQSSQQQPPYHQPAVAYQQQQDQQYQQQQYPNQSGFNQQYPGQVAPGYMQPGQAPPQGYPPFGNIQTQPVVSQNMYPNQPQVYQQGFGAPPQPIYTTQAGNPGQAAPAPGFFYGPDGHGYQQR